MSTAGDENLGPGMALKGTNGQDGSPSLALKQSNKANIMSPPPGSNKKLDRGDGPAPTDTTLMKENLDQTVITDPSATDDDDIISFKPPETQKAEPGFDDDPFKPRTQLANLPVIGNRQAVKDAALPACSTAESAENQEVQDIHCQEKDVQACSSSSEDSSKNENTSRLVNSSVKTSEFGDSVENAQNFGKPSEEKIESSLGINKEFGETAPSNRSDKPSSQLEESKVPEEVQVAGDPFKPSSQLVNTPSKPDVDDDPFKPKKQIANSPKTAADCLDPFKPSKQLSNSPEKPDAMLDPFKPKNQLSNSPEKPINEASCPFQEEDAVQKTAALSTQQPLVSSPDKSSTESSIVSDPKAQLVKSPNEVVSELDLDPFKPKTQLPNSPDGAVSSDHMKTSAMQTTNTVTVSSEKVEETTSEMDPLKVKAQPMKSPLKTDIGSDETIDPFKPKAQVINSPSQDFDPFKPNSQLANSAVMNETIKAETDPFKSKPQLTNSLAKPSDLDPFKPSSQLANSPPNIENGGTKTQLTCSTKAEETGSGVDAFKPKTQLANSPSKADDIFSEANPFQPKEQLENSPPGSIDFGTETDPFKPKAQLVNSPTNPADVSSEVDPFKPKSQLANSLAKEDDILAEVNPFQPKTQVENSPPKTVDTETEPFKPKTQLVNSPTKPADVFSELDPFKPKTQLDNSPAKEDDILAEVNPFQSKTQVENSPPKTVDTETEPFKPKTQLVNSPTKPADVSSELDPFKPKTQLVNSPAKEDILAEVNPIQSKTQLAKSPPKMVDTETDPFKSKTQLANSPAKTDDILSKVDPFKPKTQLVNSPPKTVDTEADPFKPKTQLVNSPTKADDVCAEVNPFQPKTQLANSPLKTDDSETDPFKPKTQLTNSPAKDFSDVDPFKPKTQLATSPKQPEAEHIRASSSAQLDSLAGHLSEGPKSADQEGEKAKSNTAGSDGQDAVKGLDSTDVASNPLWLASGQDLGLDENMFISGAQAFSDPAALDLLEQFGGAGQTKETDLRKCSLYMKFDPLVKPTLPRTPEKMPAPTHAAPRRAGGKSHDPLNSSQLNASQMNSSVGEESICLLGTPPKVSRRRSVLSQRRMNMSSVSQTITEEEQVKPVDLLFSLEGETSDDMFLNDPTKKSDTATSTLVDVEEGAKYTEAQWQQLQQRLVMQYEGQMLARERKLAAQLEEKAATMDRQQQRIDDLTAEHRAMTDKLLSMSSCVQEYEKTLNMLIESKEVSSADLKSQIEELKKERDQALEDAQALESSFTEFHRRYEKLKHTLEGFKKNEETLKETVKKLQDKIKASDENLAKMKAKAEGTIKEMIDKMSQKDSETARVEAELKRTKLQVHSLENTLTQKKAELAELTELCDTLIAQVGGSGK